uniref:Protein kinase domain-containing protein n=1 Tax=Amphora coffeiformis TaxID=265554 RepID=A0A7S3KZ94_9STRA|mmetsp:Transcript_10519/g.20136  ORF Transcript_10519/g.20136 Transcript_10519/m.20136 type:complete len:514 (+) Transcript_10519:120-1661(+)|eukprot:scaffold2541_cov175-Amphora_coffeaeformis.AAC.7
MSNNFGTTNLPTTTISTAAGSSYATTTVATTGSATTTACSSSFGQMQTESVALDVDNDSNNLRSYSDPSTINSGIQLPTAAPAARLPTVDMTDTIGAAAAVPPASPSVFEVPVPAPPSMALRTPQETDQRPWDTLGPPSAPLDFNRPSFQRGRRDHVLCYIPETESYERLERVLFRDENEPGRRSGMEYAYYPVPYKRPIKTIMGHVEICRVLQRSRIVHDEDSSRGSEDDYVDDDDDEVCFELTRRNVAVKVNFDSKMRELRHKHAEDPIKEIAAMQLIGDNTPHVLGCSEVLYDPGNQTLNIVMRFCQSGDLFQRLQESQSDEGPPGMPEPNARFFFRQIMHGLRGLHEKGICHRDLSPENVMLDEDESIIIDLGMCLRVPYRDGRRCLISPQGACGKLPYMSPEIYRNRSPFDGNAADVWTAGTILFCMLTGNRSYQRPHSSDPQFYWMTRDINQLLTDWQIQLTPEGLHLLQNMLQVNPRLRLTIDEVLNHPWFMAPDERPVSTHDMEF